MSTSWSAPDPRRTVTAPAFATVVPDERAGRPSAAQDLRAGLLTVAVTVLVGAPLGLLWSALAPSVEVRILGGVPNLTEPAGDTFIAADGYFLFAVVLAGVVGGLLAFALGRAHGPAVVLGLTLGGLLAALVAAQVGGQVGLPEAKAALQAGQDGLVELGVRLRAREALLGWPIASLIAYLSASALYE